MLYLLISKTSKTNLYGIDKDYHPKLTLVLPNYSNLPGLNGAK